MTAVILQARLDSSRLPEKALLSLDGKPVIYRVMEALNHVDADLRIIACPEDSYQSFKPLAEKANFIIFTGSKYDLLERFCSVIRKFSPDRIIRATGDNPFVFADAAISINNKAIALNADYAGYTNLPYGAGVESVAACSLLKAYNESDNLYDREHVCPYLYKNPGLFNVHQIPAPPQWHYPDIRLTIDTREDYERAVEIYCMLNDEQFRYHGSAIIRTYKKIYSS